MYKKFVFWVTNKRNVHFASTIIFIFFFASFLPVFVYGKIDLTDFFPFGAANGDSLLPLGDDNGQSVSIVRPFPFFNSSQNFIYVNTNGVISLQNVISTFTPVCGPVPANFIMIAPYWADVETTYTGTTAGVYYRESTDAAILQKAKTDVQAAFPGMYSTLNLNWAFITTWSNVTFYGANGCFPNIADAPRSYFQAIVTTDGTLTFVIFNYNSLTWTAGRASSSDHTWALGTYTPMCGSDCTGKNGFPAKAGFDAGDGQNFLLIGESCNEGVINLVEQSNVNNPGKWVFGTGEATIQTPPPAVVVTTTAAQEEPTPASEKCEEGWTYFEESNSCYLVIFNVSHNDAERNCVSMNAHLTSIHSDTENKFVNDLAATGTSQWNFNQTLIGFHQIGGQWVWFDGTPFSYHPWAPGQPDFNRQIQWCGMTYSDVSLYPGKWGLNQYLWDDVECNIPARSAVCKKAATVVAN